MGSLSRRALLLGLTGAAGGLTVGCVVGDPRIQGEPRTAPTPSPSPTHTPGPVWPLTGEPLSDPKEAKRAAAAVKVPDNQNEHPQVGINEADIVFVQMDGYVDLAGQSSTRLMPVYHSKFPGTVGPVRSIRPVDIPLLAPMHAVIGSTGAAPWVESYANLFPKHVDASATYMNTKGTGSFSIDQSRVRVYQGQKKFDRAVMAHPKVLSERAEQFSDGPPVPYFPFAESAAEASSAEGESAVSVSVPWKRGGEYAMGYQFNDSTGLYLRSMPWGDHVLADGSRVTTDNILVIFSGQHFGKLMSGQGGKEPIHEIENSDGRFFYANGGKHVSGTWTKGPVNEVFEFKLADDSPLLMAPGRTFVELVSLKTELSVL